MNTCVCDSPCKVVSSDEATAVNGANVWHFSEHGNVRKPHHTTLFLYPYLQLLPPHCKIVFEEPWRHADRLEPENEVDTPTVKNSTLRSITTAKNDASIVSEGTFPAGASTVQSETLEDAMARVSQFPLYTELSMITYQKPGRSETIVKICRQTSSAKDPDPNSPIESATYHYCLPSWVAVGARSPDILRHLSWWTNLEALRTRSDDEAYESVRNALGLYFTETNEPHFAPHLVSLARSLYRETYTWFDADVYRKPNLDVLGQLLPRVTEVRDHELTAFLKEHPDCHTCIMPYFEQGPDGKQMPTDVDAMPIVRHPCGHHFSHLGCLEKTVTASMAMEVNPHSNCSMCRQSMGITDPFRAWPDFEDRHPECQTQWAQLQNAGFYRAPHPEQVLVPRHPNDVIDHLFRIKSAIEAVKPSWSKSYGSLGWAGPGPEKLFYDTEPSQRVNTSLKPEFSMAFSELAGLIPVVDERWRPITTAAELLAKFRESLELLLKQDVTPGAPIKKHLAPSSRTMFFEYVLFALVNFYVPVRDQDEGLLRVELKYAHKYPTRHHFYYKKVVGPHVKDCQCLDCAVIFVSIHPYGCWCRKCPAFRVSVGKEVRTDTGPQIPTSVADTGVEYMDTDSDSDSEYMEM